MDTTPSPSDDQGEESNARDALQALQLTAADYFDTLSEAAADLTRQARVIYETNREYYQTHPGRVLGTAAAVGVVIGLLMGRRS